MTNEQTTNETEPEGIRPYGLGKFNTILDEYVYSISLDGGADEEESYPDGDGWYGLMRNGRTIFRDHDPLLETLNEAEQEQLTSSAGVIVREDSSGFVYVDYYTDKAELDKAWEEIQAEFSSVRCDQCEALMINGLFCHETGCPNTKSRYDSESGEWIKQRKCFDCGCTVDADDECCQSEEQN